jgi:hypothetical protein
LLRRGLSRTGWPPSWVRKPLKNNYDVVIVSGGVHCERSSGRYLFDALMSVGHDFGIEVDGFQAPGI